MDSDEFHFLMFLMMFFLIFTLVGRYDIYASVWMTMVFGTLKLLGVVRWNWIVIFFPLLIEIVVLILVAISYYMSLA